MIRITDEMQLSTTTLNVDRSDLQLNTLSNEASSGKRVATPSDDPAAYSQVVTTNAQLARMNARVQTLGTASGNLSTVDGALSSAADLFTQAKAVAVEMANGTQSATDRATAATQIGAIKTQILALANTQGTNGYLFGGTATGTAPFDANGNFLGNAQTTSVEIADGVTSQSNASGANAFTAAGGQDVFAALDALTTALQTNNVAGITTGITSMDSAGTQITAEQVHAGVLANRLQTSQSILQTAATTAQTQVSNVQDADVAKVYSELSSAQTSYQAALSVNQRILATLATRFSG
jgi:flagellar hook-associated protein 3 FlgL